MPEFFYEALDKGGKQVRGTTGAGSEDIVIERLRGMGYYPLQVVQQRAPRGQVDLCALPGIRHVAQRIKPRHIMTFTRQLATLIDAGLPIVRSLGILQRQVESAVFKDKIRQITEDIEGGSSLSEAMAKHPKVFDNLYVNMVRAGEIGGVLEAVLNKVAEFLEKRQMLVGKIRSAMMYPLVVSSLALVIVTFILWKIMPKFAEIFHSLNAELPWLTQTLIDMSNVLLHQTWKVILVVAAVGFLLRKVNGTREGRRLFDRIRMRLPVFGPLYQKVAIARFAGTLATLVQSGVPILQALDIVRDTSGNEVIADAMNDVYLSVKDGETIAEPLSRCSVFPPMVVHMVAVGEETGAIDQMLNKVAEVYEAEVNDTVAALTAILEPIMIVFLGTIIGTIVVALYLPLFSLTTVFGKNG